MSKDERKYYIVENNVVVKVLTSDELETMIQKLMNKQSKRDKLSDVDDKPIFYSFSRKQVDQLNERKDKTKDYLDGLLDRACSGIIRNGR